MYKKHNGRPPDLVFDQPECQKTERMQEVHFLRLPLSKAFYSFSR